MQITDIATVRVNAERGRTWLFVEVSTDTGDVGIGEASQSRFDAGVELLVQQMKAHLIGRHPMDLIEPLRTKLLHDPFADRTRYSAFSGIEQALWDLAGKAVGQPVHRLSGVLMSTEFDCTRTSMSRSKEIRLTPSHGSRPSQSQKDSRRSRCIPLYSVRILRQARHWGVPNCSWPLLACEPFVP